jgi:hypothetical protein
MGCLKLVAAVVGLLLLSFLIICLKWWFHA